MGARLGPRSGPSSRGRQPTAGHGRRVGRTAPVARRLARAPWLPGRRLTAGRAFRCTCPLSGQFGAPHARDRAGSEPFVRPRDLRAGTCAGVPAGRSSSGWATAPSAGGAVRPDQQSELRMGRGPGSDCQSETRLSGMVSRTEAVAIRTGSPACRARGPEVRTGSPTRRGAAGAVSDVRSGRPGAAEDDPRHAAV